MYTLSLHDALPLIKLIRVSLGTVRHPRRFKIVVIDIQITLKQMLRDFIGIRVNRAKKSGMVNITSSVNSRERSGINTILHELNPLFTINVTIDRKSGSAGMPRPISYAVFCLKKKIQTLLHPSAAGDASAGRRVRCRDRRDPPHDPADPLHHPLGLPAR